jgi:hypothetical protein
LDGVIRHFYEGVVGPYWDPERRFIEEEYRTIGFPFEEIEMPHYEIQNTWSLEAMAGYLNTWSAVQHYIKANGKNPVDSILPDLKEKWGGQPKVKVYTPVILRTGRI